MVLIAWTQSTSPSVTALQSTGSRVDPVAHPSITQAVSCRGARSMDADSDWLGGHLIASASNRTAAHALH